MNENVASTPIGPNVSWILRGNKIDVYKREDGGWNRLLGAFDVGAPLSHEEICGRFMSAGTVRQFAQSIGATPVPTTGGKYAPGSVIDHGSNAAG